MFIGNVDFMQSSDGSLSVYGEKELVSSAVLLGLSSRMLREVLLGGGGTGNGKKTRVTPPSSGQINITLKSLIRALYTRLLGAVLRRINEQLHRLLCVACRLLLALREKVKNIRQLLLLQKCEIL